RLASLRLRSTGCWNSHIQAIQMKRQASRYELALRDAQRIDDSIKVLCSWTSTVWSITDSTGNCWMQCRRDRYYALSAISTNSHQSKKCLSPTADLSTLRSVSTSNASSP